MRVSLLIPVLAVAACVDPVVSAEGEGDEGEGEEGEGEEGEGEGDVVGEGEGDVGEGEGEGEGEGDVVDGAVFFAADVLHIVDITVAEADLDALDNDTDNRVAAVISYDGVVVENAGIKKKGQSTMRPLDEKCSFNVKLDEFVDGADIDGVQKFSLNNTIMDPTFTSEPLTYLLYERAGIPAPRTAHAVVRFNGETKGIYVVVEGVAKRFLRQRFGDGDGNLYEGPWDFTQDANNLELKDEDEGRTREDIFALQAAVMQSDDGELLGALDPVLDVDETMRTLAVDMAYCLWDGYTIAAWNFYLYHGPDGKFVFLPHGADWPYYVADLDPMNVDFRPWGGDFPAGELAIRLVRADVDGYRAALVDVRDNAFDVGVLNGRLEQIATILHTADADDDVLAGELGAFDDNIDTARDFNVERRAFLDGI